MNNIIPFDQRVGEFSKKVVSNGGGGDNGDMEARVAKLEAVTAKTSERLAAIEKDTGAIKAQIDTVAKYYATKEDLAMLRVDVHKAINEQTWKFITWMTGLSTALVGVTYFIAKYVK